MLEHKAKNETTGPLPANSSKLQMTMLIFAFDKRHRNNLALPHPLIFDADTPLADRPTDRFEADAEALEHGDVHQVGALIVAW